MNKYKYLPSLMIIIFAVMFLPSCNNATVTQPSSSPTVTIQAKLINTLWLVVSVNGITLDKDTDISLNFSDSGTFQGDAMCNFYGGKYATENNNTLKMTETVITLLLCPQKGNQGQVNSYLQTLSLVSSYKITENHLVFYGKDDKELVVLQLP